MKIVEFISRKALTRNIAVWGSGESSRNIRDLLINNNIDYTLFDSAKEKQGTFVDGKEIFAPSFITSDCFVLISFLHFREVEWQLTQMGLKEIDDYIWALELEYYEALLQMPREPRVTEINFEMLHRIESLLRYNVDTEMIDWLDRDEFEKYETELGFQNHYEKKYNKRYKRKIMEYFLVEKLLDFSNWDQKDVYLDIGACTSPFVKYIRECKQLEAYALDIEKGPYEDLDYYLEEDATKMHFSQNSIRAISMQSSYEMFVGDADIQFLSEAARVLKPGGEIIILPLYLHEEYLSTTSPNHYKKGYADSGSLECIRTDCYSWIKMARFYDVKSLKARILDKAKKVGMQAKVFILPDSWVEMDGISYLKFVLYLKKRGY